MMWLNCLVVCLAAADEPPPAARGIQVDMQVVRVTADKPALRPPTSATSTSTGGFMFEAFARSALAELMDAVSAEPESSVLSAPRLITLDGQQASLSIGENAHYLVADDDGCLRVAETPEFVDGLLIEVTPRIGDGAAIELSVDRIRLNRMLGRETLPGVPLDVGRPVVKTVETSAKLVLADDMAAAIQLPTAAAEDGLIILYVTARIVDVPEDGAVVPPAD